MRIPTLAAVASIACLSASAVPAAQDAELRKGPSPAGQQQARTARADIADWDQAELRHGYSAERLIGMKAKGRQGETIGDVKDIVIDRQGKVVALIVGHGGVLGIGDKHLRLPLTEMNTDAKVESVTVPVAKDSVESYRIKDERQAKDARPVAEMTAEIKVSELLDDHVALRGGAKYGDVKDFVIGRDGRIKAVVVEADDAGRRVRFAFPWVADSYDASRNRFSYDYERNEVEKMKPFDYAALGIAERGRRAVATRAPGASGTGSTGARQGTGAASGGAR